MELRDVVLTALARFRQEFGDVVEANRADFAAYLRDAGAPPVGDDEEEDEHEADDARSRNAVECRAELIDVGIPRRDSAAALEEWTRLSAPHALETSDGVVYPHREYYLNEYLMMIRDAFLDIDVAKAPKRITRFGVILESGHDEEPSPLERQRLAALPAATKFVAALDSKTRRAPHRPILPQFVEAYNLLQDTELAALLGKTCVALISTPPALPAALAKSLDAAQKVLGADVGVAHVLSARMDEHWARRNEFFESQREFFGQFLLDLSRLMAAPL